MTDTAVKVAVSARPTVGLCAGKDCRKRCEFAKMRNALERECDVLELKCVGICKGPVVVAHADSDQALVFAKVRSKQQRQSVLSLIGRPRRPSAALRKLQVSTKVHKAAVRRFRHASA